MSGAIPYSPRYTVDDYQQWQGDWELWFGSAVVVSPSAGYQHQQLGRTLLRLIDRQLRDGTPQCHCEILYGIDWRIDRFTVVRPDLLVMCEPVTTQWIETPPALIVEILSPSTAEKDRGPKRELYAQQGVGWYIMADPERQDVEILRLDTNTNAYVRQPITEAILHDECELGIDPATLWAV